MLVEVFQFLLVCTEVAHRLPGVLKHSSVFVGSEAKLFASGKHPGDWKIATLEVEGDYLVLTWI